jgi:hypothetical protein
MLSTTPNRLSFNPIPLDEMIADRRSDARAQLVFCASMTHANKIRASVIAPGDRCTSFNPRFKPEFPSCLPSRQAAASTTHKTAGGHLWHTLRQIGAISGRWVHFGSASALGGEQRGNRFAGRRGAQAEQQLVDRLGGKERIQSGEEVCQRRVLLVTLQAVFSNMSRTRRRSPRRNVSEHVPWNRYCRLSVSHR